MDIRRILIANRGEIALRIIRSAHLLHIECGVIYMLEEADSEFVRKADEAYSIGSGSLHETYLNVEAIVDLALSHRFDAIHPGYGFLSENSVFAQACEKSGVIFIGPSSESIRLMSDKVMSRTFVNDLGVPLIPYVADRGEGDFVGEVCRMQLPWLVKASAGGGGKGMRIVLRKEDLHRSLAEARREAFNYFKDDSVYVERLLENARHIEVQILADQFGHVVHLFERECSIQRRYQKLIEESPAQVLARDVRDALIEAALIISRRMHYVGAGTVEFLLDEDGKFYFLEMNTRIQVEHAVTEMVTGIDLVIEQIKIAEGKALSFAQSEVRLRGHAMECRVYAEDAFRHFLPSSGDVCFYQEPPKWLARVDSSIAGSAHVSDLFDPLIAKVISFGLDREEARVKLERALGDYLIHGVSTSISFLKEVLRSSEFIENRISTFFCERNRDFLLSSYRLREGSIPVQYVVAAYLFRFCRAEESAAVKYTVWSEMGYWRNRMTLTLEIFELKREIKYKPLSSFSFWFSVDGSKNYVMSADVDKETVLLITDEGTIETHVSKTDKGIFISIFGLSFRIYGFERERMKVGEVLHGGGISNSQEVQAPLSGKVLSVNAVLGDSIQKGDLLVLIESMKMENRVLAPCDGVVSNVLVQTGDQVSGSKLLMVIDKIKESVS